MLLYNLSTGVTLMLAVVALYALADVVQQRRDAEQVGTRDVALQPGRFDARLEAVPVDRVAPGAAARP